MSLTRSLEAAKVVGRKCFREWPEASSRRCASQEIVILDAAPRRVSRPRCPQAFVENEDNRAATDRMGREELTPFSRPRCGKPSPSIRQPDGLMSGRELRH